MRSFLILDSRVGEELDPLLTPGPNTLEVTGSLVTGGSFSGSDHVRVIGSGDSLSTASVVPNPLNPEGALTFRTTSQGPITVKVFDLQGRLMRTLMRAEALPAGLHTVRIGGRGENGEILASGVYFFRVEAAEAVLTGRFTILK
jgi:hypothetical protein